MAQSHREASRRLFEIAEQQQGFFTTKQAKAAGFAENTHPYHVQVGNWIREHRGIYRLALFPVTDRPDLVLWALWSRNRDEEVVGVYSHHTALRVHAQIRTHKRPVICHNPTATVGYHITLDVERYAEMTAIGRSS